jgi:GrpB-like predicted nucleotidyltransferase (UPF0157 family)
MADAAKRLSRQPLGAKEHDKQSKMTDNSMIGLPKGVVFLLPYNPAWKRLYEEEKKILQNSIGDNILDIQHVGSTSITGMIAKPIIDIAIAVNNFEGATICIEPIESLGYQYRGELGIPRRHYFSKGDPRTYHIHMNEIGSGDWNNQILFRDYLINHAKSAQEYANLKIELAKRFPTDIDKYMEGKDSFIRHIIYLANLETQGNQ